MARTYNLKGGQYMYPNEYKLIGTVRGTTLLQPAFGEVLIEGDVIEAETHNVIQKNGVLSSKATVALDGTNTIITPSNIDIGGSLEDELKLLLLFETATTLPSTTFIKVKNTNIPVINVNDYAIPANTPILFVLFDNKFYAYKSVGGTGGGTTPSPDVLELHSGTFNSLKAQVNYSVTKLGRVCTISIRITAAAGQQNVISGNLLYKIWSSIPSQFAPSTKYPLIANETTFKAFTYANAYVEYASPPLQPMRVWISPDGIEVEAGQWGITLPLSFSFTYFTDGVV